ncbi:MAG: hypothetical protein IT379_36105 [Deltaproteobacteria bacterium]|nr:hypothetical protein [Deltaproteobacteria bacterium]
MRAWLLGALTFASCVVGAGCDGCGCGAAGYVAELASARGIVEHDEAAQGLDWRATEVGDRYASGDAVRTARDSEARVKLGRSGGLKLAPRTTVRFLSARPNKRAPRLSIDTGQAELEAAEEELVIVTGMGEAQVERGSRVRLDRASGGLLRLEVLVGVASIEREGEAPVTARVDESLEIAVGRAVVVVRAADAGGPRQRGDAGTERSDANVAVGPSDPIEPDAGAPSGARDAGGATGPAPIDPAPLGPSHAALTLGVGDGAVVHDPAAPTPIRFRFANVCPGEGVVELVGRGGASARGTGSAVVVVPPGPHRYRVRCLEGGATSGPYAVRVARDTGGGASISRTAPRNSVDADGRRYTILYQNLLPIMTFRWTRSPPGATRFVLRLEGPRGTRTMRTTQPRHTVGSLGEGNYRFSFAAVEGASGRSPETSLRIDFDNATPAARLSSPQGPVVSGASVRVAGVALRGASVTAGGHRVEVDGQGRFDQMVTAGGEGAFVIRIAHPDRGVHYYVRRFGSR